MAPPRMTPSAGRYRGGLSDQRDRHAGGHGRHHDHDDAPRAGEAAERDAGVVGEVDAQAGDQLATAGRSASATHEPLAQLVGDDDGRRQRQGEGVPPLTSCHAASGRCPVP